MSTNPTPTQQGGALANVHALTVLVCQDCIDLKGEMCNNPQCVFCRRTMAEVRRYLDVMLLCPIVDGERLVLVGDAVTDEDTRRAAVTGPRNDAARTARNRDEAQDIIMASEEALGQCFDAATRHDLASRITEALDAATASPTPAESHVADMAEPKSEAEPICIHCGRELESREFGPPINDITWSHIHNGVVWCDWYAASTPPESTRVAGEQENTMETWLKEVESACNSALLDIYDLSIANAPIPAKDCREIADCIGHRVGQIREAVTAARAAPPADNDADVVQRIRDEISKLPADSWDGYFSPQAIDQAIDRATTKGDR